MQIKMKQCSAHPAPMKPHLSGGSEVISALVSPSRMSNGTDAAVEPLDAAASAILAGGYCCSEKDWRYSV
jgi:hypothetical protein